MPFSPEYWVRTKWLRADLEGKTVQFRLTEPTGVLHGYGIFRVIQSDILAVPQEPKIGVAATAMKRRGVVADPERFQLVRWVKSLNAVKPWLRAIEKLGEVRQEGMGKTWWERSLIFASGAKQVVRESVMDTWRTFLNRRPGASAGRSGRGLARLHRVQGHP